MESFNDQFIDPMNTSIGGLKLWQWFVIGGSIGVAWGFIFGKTNA